MTKVIVLGGTGLLGLAVTEEIRNAGLEVLVSARNINDLPGSGAGGKFELNSQDLTLSSLAAKLAPGDLIVNCIGVVKAKISEESSSSVTNAIRTNSLFPHRLAEVASQAKANVVQIATDCVFDGTVGGYLESSLHNATDVYGKSKSLGEVRSDNFLNLRVSIIGTEKSSNPTSLVEWVLSQPRNAKIRGFRNHFWNGVPAYVFGQVAAGLAKQNQFFSGTQHLVPQDTISKFQLVSEIAKRFDRFDIEVENFESESSVNRTLSTQDPELNRKLWKLGGYLEIPKISELVEHMVVAP